MKLDDIDKLIAAATTGPWSKNGYYVVDNTVIIADTFSDANAAFIAASRELMPKLLKVARLAKLAHRGTKDRECTCVVCKLSEALAELEQP